MNFFQFLRTFAREPQRRAAIILLYAVFATAFWKYFNISDPGSFLSGETKTLSALVLFGLGPIIIIKLFFRESLGDYGLKTGDPRFALRAFLILFLPMLAVAYLAGHDANYQTIYPFNESLRPSNRQGESPPIDLFVLHSLFYSAYYFGWEFFFRGFIQHGLSAHFGLGGAILVQTVISTMLHFGHPPGELVGAVFVGFLWGFLAVKSGSILGGLVQHAMLGIALDAVIVYRF